MYVQTEYLHIYIIFSVAKYLHREMKSYTLRSDIFTLNFQCYSFRYVALLGGGQDVQRVRGE